MSEEVVVSADHAEHHDPVADRLGMWLFLITEIFLFGVLFLTFAVYCWGARDDFAYCSRLLSVTYGAGNTLILLTSSLTLALAVAAVQKGHRTMAVVCLVATLLLAGGFLGVKSVEWSDKIHHGYYPVTWDQPDATLSSFTAGHRSVAGDWPKGRQMFFALYFLMTGLHAVHVVAGLAAILVTLVLVLKDRVDTARPAIIENVGLYWHLVDIVWIYLFPLLYLIG
jgi:cytochrome c oxidase subunit 3